MKKLLKYFIGLFFVLSFNAYSNDCNEETIISPKQTITVYSDSSEHYDNEPNFASGHQQTRDIWVRRCYRPYVDGYYIYQLVDLITEKSNTNELTDQISGYAVQDDKERFVVLPKSTSVYVSEKVRVIESYSTLSPRATEINLSEPFRLILDTCQNYETIFQAPIYQNSGIYLGCNIDGEKIKTLYFNGDSTSTTNTTLKISGSWYDPAYSGMGFNIDQIAGGTVIYYYGYKGNQNGQPLWLISAVTNKNIQKNETYSIEMFSGYAGNGADFNTKPTVDSGVQSWGTLELTFNSCSSGIAILRGNDGEQTFNIVSLAPIDGISCQE